MSEPAQVLGPYTVLRKIGAGGMGEVVLARDPRLEREVALKLLPAELRDDPDRRQRFLREARAVAKLAHPNITAIHEVGESGGRDYIAFEFVEGQTLDQLVRGRRLSLAELIDLALPLADALAYAHERGVIHRDLKAVNVMVTPRGHPKLLDFGLAKLLHGEGEPRKQQSTTLTVEGAIFGTPQAMSPEQALGRAVDERSDVFSFGSLLYEMAAGQPAFRGGTVMEVMDAVIHAEPPELARLRPDLPEGFAQIVAKAMRKDPAERYPSIAGLVADLKHFKRTTESGLVPVARARRALVPAVLAAGAVVVLALAWVLFGGERGERSGPAPAGADAADAGAAGPRSIAVMGFELLGSPAEAALDRALTSLVTTALAEAGDVDVASSSKVVACLRSAGLESGAPFDPGLAARAAAIAGADLMLVGQVLVRPKALVLTAELVDVESGNALDTLRREVASEDELFALAEGLVADVRAGLGLGRGRGAGIDLRELTDSPEAYYKFVAGELAMHEQRFTDARRLLSQAVEIDPSFAFAYVRLGIASEWEADPAAAREAYQAARAHSDRLPERWRRVVDVVLAYARGEMDAAFALARELTAEPNPLPEAFNTLGEILTHVTRYEDTIRARAAFLRALEIDPNFQIVLYHIVSHTLEIGDVEVLDELRARLAGQAVNPEGLHYLELGSLLGHREPAAAVRHIEAAGRQAEDIEEYVWSLRELGRLDDAARALAAMSPEPGSNMLRNQKTYQGDLAFHRGHLRDALELYLQAAATMALGDEAALAWYGTNLARSQIQAARTAQLLGEPLERVLALADEASRLDRHGLCARFWRTRWLVEAGRLEDAAAELERMRAIAAECTSQVPAAWLGLAATELALGQGRPAEARERFAAAEALPRGVRPWTVTELVRARLARAESDAPAELAAWRTALHAAHDSSEGQPDLIIHALYGLADAEDRAGETEAARAHGRELLAAWADGEDDVALLEDARRRWGE